MRNAGTLFVQSNKQKKLQDSHMSIVTFAEPSTYEVTLIRASCKPVLILHREKCHQSGRAAKWHITTVTLLEKLNSEAIDGIRALWMEPVFHTSSAETTQLHPPAPLLPCTPAPSALPPLVLVFRAGTRLSATHRYETRTRLTVCHGVLD